MYKLIPENIELNQLMTLIEQERLFIKIKPKYVRIKDYEVFKKVIREGSLYMKTKKGYTISTLRAFDDEEIKKQAWNGNKYFTLEE